MDTEIWLSDYRLNLEETIDELIGMGKKITTVVPMAYYNNGAMVTIVKALIIYK